MTLRVPNIDAREAPDPLLLPPGIYKGRIIEMMEIKPSKTWEYMCYITCKVELIGLGRIVFVSVMGYPPAIYMIQAAKDYYMSREDLYKVKIEVFQEHKRNSAQPLWNGTDDPSPKDSD